jgi:hypothetical protein
MKSHSRRRPNKPRARTKLTAKQPTELAKTKTEPEEVEIARTDADPAPVLPRFDEPRLSAQEQNRQPRHDYGVRNTERLIEKSVRSDVDHDSRPRFWGYDMWVKVAKFVISASASVGVIVSAYRGRLPKWANKGMSSRP